MARAAAYTASTLGAGLRRAGSDIASALMGIQGRRDQQAENRKQEQRYALDFALRQQQVKEDGEARKQARELAQQEQAYRDRVRQEDIEFRRQTRVADALSEATRGRTSGYPNARIVVPEVSISGDPLTPGTALMMQGGGAPYVEYGGYDLDADPEWQRERARIEAQGAVQRGLVEARADVSPARAPLRPTEIQARYRTVLPRAEKAIAYLDKYIEEHGSVPTEAWLSRVSGGRFLQSEEVQSYRQAAEAAASAILRAESGAAIPDSEVARYAEQLVPVPGDKPDVVRRKLEAVRLTLDAMRDIAWGGTMPPESGPLTDDEFWNSLRVP